MRFLRKGHPGFRWALNIITASILARDRKGDRDTARHRETQERKPSETETVSGVTLPQPKESQETPELEGKEGSSSEPLKRPHPANTLISDFWSPKLQENKFVVLSH